MKTFHPMQPYPPLTIATITGAFVLALLASVPARAQQASAEPAAPTTSTANASPNLPNEPGTNQDQPVTLSPFEVQESSNAGYGASTTSSVARVAQSYLDVPQDINVVTSEFINDFNIQDNQRLFEFVPNMMINFNSSFYIRGVEVDLNYINGVQSGISNEAIPTQFYDRVEVVKGPSSAAFGLGEPGGIINYVSKVPTGRTDGEVTIGIGDHNNYLANFDIEGKANSGIFNGLEYRLVGYYDHGWSVLKNISEHEGEGFQLSLKDDLNTTTSMQMIVSYAQEGANAHADQSYWFRTITGIDILHYSYGLPLLPHTISFDTDETPVGWGNMDVYNPFRFTFITDKALADDHVHIRATLVGENSPQNDHYTQIDNIYNPSPGVYTTGVDREETLGTVNDVSANIDAEAKYTFGSGLAAVTSTTLAGLDIRQQRDDSSTFGPPDINPDGSIHTINIYNPDLSALYTPYGTYTSPSGEVESPVLYYNNSAEDDQQYGVYAQEELSFLNDRVTLMGGWRYDAFKDVFMNIISGTVTNPGWENTKPGAPRGAFIIKPLPWLSVYGLYTMHRDPSAYAYQYGISVRGDIQPATIAQYNNFQNTFSYQPNGVDIEGGVKATFLGGKLTVSVDVFHEVLRGQVAAINTIIIKDPDGSDTQIVQQAVTGEGIHGYEVEIFGQPTPRLSFILDYGLTHGLDFPIVNNLPFYIDPPTTISGHAKYDFGDLRGHGFFVTFGGIWYSTYWLEQFPTPEYYWNKEQYSVDAGVGFQWNRGRDMIYANSDNITNESNQLALEGRGYTEAPREQAFLTYKHSF
jgi:outer membrane receptor protein involved in Fe transport